MKKDLDKILIKNLIRFENTNESAYLFRNKLKKYNSTCHSKIKRKIYVGCWKNENNCLLYCLNQYKCFPLRKFRKTLKILNFDDQIEFINQTLKK